MVDAFVPQTHRPGAEADVHFDFGHVTVKPAGELVTCYLFAFRMSYSGKAVHRIFLCTSIGRVHGGCLPWLRSAQRPSYRVELRALGSASPAGTSA